MASDPFEGRLVRDSEGNKIGKVLEVYRDEKTDQPTWGVVKTGLSGKRRFVPLSNAGSGASRDLTIPVTEDRVEEAPDVEEHERLSPDLESRLHDHYSSRGHSGGGRSAGAAGAGTAAVAAAGASQGRDRDIDRGRDSDRGRDRGPDLDRDRSQEASGVTKSTMETARGRQRDEFGGFNLGAALLGWLVAAGIAILLTAIVSAAGAAIGFTEVSESDARSSAGTISIVGGAILLLILGLAYFTGGYNAGRLSRFDGGRQGIGVWIIGLLVTLLLAAAGAIFGSEYNVLQRLDLPRIPIDEGSLATGGIIALVAIILGTLLAAFLGGKVGERYHKKVDRVAYEGS
ncbi:MAG: PRC-barrel domain-containing protein [Thermoleophilaceae bacterium]